MVLRANAGRTRSVTPLPATNRAVHSKYGCFWDRGDNKYANKKELLEIPARVRRWVNETVVRFVNARDALVADGRVRSVGNVRVLSVYDKPVSKPREIDPTNFNVETVREAMASDVSSPSWWCKRNVVKESRSFAAAKANSAELELTYRNKSPHSSRAHSIQLLKCLSSCFPIWAAFKW